MMDDPKLPFVGEDLIDCPESLTMGLKLPIYIVSDDIFHCPAKPTVRENMVDCPSLSTVRENMGNGPAMPTVRENMVDYPALPTMRENMIHCPTTPTVRKNMVDCPASSTLREYVTCGICKDLFTDPQLLPCRHTYCIKCVEEHLQQDQIQCPECHEISTEAKIHPDFKTQTFVDYFRRQENDSVPQTQTNNTVCEMCKNKDNPLKSKCLDCNQLMCSSCDVTHSGMTLFKDHKVNNIEQEIKQYQNKVQEVIEQLQEKQKKIWVMCESLDGIYKDIEMSKERSTKDIIRYANHLWEGIVTHHKYLKQTVYDTTQQMESILTDTCKKGLNIHVEFNGMFAKLNKSIKSEDVAELIEAEKRAINFMDNQFKSQRSKVNEYLDVLEILSSLEIARGEKLDFWKALAVDVIKVTRNIGNDFVYEQLTDTEYEHIMHRNLMELEYKLEKCVKLDKVPRKLLLISDDELWCAMDNVLHIYDVDCRRLRSVKHKYITDLNSIAVAFNGEIILASHSSMGLNVMNSKLNSLSQHFPGAYADVFTFGDKFCALEYKEARIEVYKYNGSSWETDITFDLGYGRVSCRDKMFVDDSGACISCYNNHCLYMYTFHGEFLCQTGSQGSQGPGKLKHPVLCYVSPQGGAVVADEGNGQIQMYNKERDTWHIVMSKGQYSPSYACSDFKRSTFYIISRETKELVKFTCKNQH